MLRWLTAGESHGPALMAVLEGLPAGVLTTTSDVADELARRRLGHGRGPGWRSRRTRSSSSAASGTASRRAARWPCASATPSGPSGRRS
jgi:chorismate synthase